MLQCPNCHLALEEHMQGDVEIDVCGECGGVWLDHGELELISNGQDFEPHTEALDSLPELRCPRCEADRFTTIEMEEGTLAQCGVCRGIFVNGPTVQRICSVPKGSDSGTGRRRAADAAINAYDIADIIGDFF